MIFRTFRSFRRGLLLLKPQISRQSRHATLNYVTRVIFTAKLRVRFCRELGVGEEWRIYQARNSVRDRLNEFRKLRSRRRMYHLLCYGRL